MPKYLIERSIPGAGSLSPEELRAASANSCSVLRELGPRIQWVHSYVTEDKITCVYIAPSEEMIREHARRAGLPADAVMEIRTVIDPTTAEATPTRRGAAPVGATAAMALLAAFAGLGMSGCSPSDIDVVTPSTRYSMVQAADAPSDAGLEDELATLRRAVAPYHRLAAAQEAGWTVLVPRCRDNQPEGGMGWHFANPAYVDGALDVREPEALIYEPQKDGSMRFVAVEFVVPFAIRAADAEPPELLGETFLQNFGDELWMLHVWVGRNNPNGMFATWNPTVSCAYAEE